MVLPYRFGTHSGYLEACRDVGTAVVAPAVGCYHDQHDCPTFRLYDIEGTLPGALRAAIDGRLEWTATQEERRVEAEGVRAAHRRLYRQVTGLSTLPRPLGWLGGWVELADDAVPVDDDHQDPTAGGTLHWPLWTMRPISPG